MPPTVVRDIAIQPLDLRLRTPFGIAGGVQEVARNVLVTVTLADGTRGYGEAAPLPAYNGETQAAALEALAGVSAVALGADASDWRELAGRFRTLAGHASGSAQCAFEVALLDAWTRSVGVPLWRFFGGASSRLETDMTVTTGTVEQASCDVQAIRARGIRVIKVKVGAAAGVEHDLARLTAIHEVAPDAPLIVDGNAGLTRDAAARLALGLRRRGIVPALLEQWLPKDDLPGLRELHEESGWPVAADESVVTPVDALRVAHAGAAQVINIKLMKAGVAAALDIAAVARSTGLGLMIGGNVESILAMTASACFAAGLGGFRHADLDTPWFLAENPFVGGFTAEGGQLSVAHITAGHGVSPRM
ncbi:MAG TPA: dipeptide epimerase [Opitutaceae bacterium]